jgi:hypothetical protein
MPLLSIPNTFVPFTKILSSDMNANFTAISTLLNTTGLDDTNIQAAGISPTTKLKTTGASAGQVLGYNGSAIAWLASSLGNLYDFILGSSGDVSSGIATNSTFASITQADGKRIFILPTYSTTENWSITKQLTVSGTGYQSRINGTVTFSSAADQSLLTNCRVSDTVTLQAGADMVVVAPIWLDSGKSFAIDSTVTGEYVLGIQAS